jgi:hypothetical protein
MKKLVVLTLLVLTVATGCVSLNQAAYERSLAKHGVIGKGDDIRAYKACENYVSKLDEMKEMSITNRLAVGLAFLVMTPFMDGVLRNKP